MWAHPESFWLLAALPPLALGMARSRRRRRTDWRALGQAGRPKGDGGWAWLLTIACWVVGLAGPRWGRTPTGSLPPGHDVVLAIDVSRSMGARDATPDRLGVAILAAESLIDAIAGDPGNRVGVIAFAGRGAIRCVLTDRPGAAIDAVLGLRPGTVEPGGTNLGAALETAVAAFDDRDRDGGRTIVLLSDGEDLEGAGAARAARLRDLHVVVHTVAIGDGTAGHPLPAPDGKGVLTYQGKRVDSRRDDRTLAAIARATRGIPVVLGTQPADLGDLYSSRIAPLSRRRGKVARAPERVERFGGFILAGIAIGLSGVLRRPSGRAWLPTAFLVIATAASDSDRDPAASAVARGRAAFEANRFVEARDAFERAIALAPRSAIPRYNLAATLFRLGRYPEARGAYDQARETADAPLRMKIDYALGNTALALGDLAAAIASYDSCLASRARGTGLPEVRRDAAINRRFVQQESRRAALPPTVPPESGSPPTRKPPTWAPDGDDRNPDGRLGHLGGRPDGATNAGVRAESPGRGQGGAGGTGPADTQPGSPDAQLDEALEQIREARRHRLENKPPPFDPARKDW